MAIAWVLAEILRAFSWETHTQPGEFVYRSKAELQAAWQQDGGKEERMPKVDFENEIVLAVFAGQKDGTGHRIRVELVLVDKEGKNAAVVYKEYTPGAGSKGSQKSYPNHVVVIKKTASEFKFVDAESVDGKALLELVKQPTK